MTRQTKAFWLGLFMLGGMVIGLGVLIWLGASNWFRETHSYVTYFDYTVQGLTMDAAVKFRGVQVGRVQDIRVAPDGRLIETVMELEPVFVVTDSLRAKVELTGITGMKYIELDYVGPEKQRLHPELSFEPPHPVIPSYFGGFEEIGQALRDVYDKIMIIDTEGISYRTKTFLEAVTSTAVNADSLLADTSLTSWAVALHRTTGKLDSMLGELDVAYYDEEVEKALRELSQGAKHFNQTFAALEKQAEGMNVDVKLDSIADNLNNLIVATTEFLGRFQYQSAQVLIDVSTAVSALNKSIVQLDEMMISMETYPSKILYTGPPPKEK